MNVLSFDPSSKRLGYAYFVGRELEQCGLVKPDKDTLPVAMRIIQIADTVPGLIKRYEPDFVLIEFFTEPPKSIGGDRGPALAVCGQAYGAVLISAMKADWGGDDPRNCVVPISNTWTKGTTKDSRKVYAGLNYPKKYEASQDPGGDAADAICLGEHWIGRRD